MGASIESLSAYNAVIGPNFIIHNSSFTDKVILEQTQNKKFINVKQSFTRCSLITDGDRLFISSDRGIHRALINQNFNSLFVSSEIHFLARSSNKRVGRSKCRQAYNV